MSSIVATIILFFAKNQAIQRNDELICNLASLSPSLRWLRLEPHFLINWSQANERKPDNYPSEHFWTFWNIKMYFLPELQHDPDKVIQTFIKWVFTLTRSFTKIQDVSVIFPLFLALEDDNKDVTMGYIMSSSSTDCSVSSLVTSLLPEQVQCPPPIRHSLSIIIKSVHGQHYADLSSPLSVI